MNSIELMSSTGKSDTGCNDISLRKVHIGGNPRVGLPIHSNDIGIQITTFPWNATDDGIWGVTLNLVIYVK